MQHSHNHLCMYAHTHRYIYIYMYICICLSACAFQWALALGPCGQWRSRLAGAISCFGNVDESFARRSPFEGRPKGVDRGSIRCLFLGVGSQEKNRETHKPHNNTKKTTRLRVCILDMANCGLFLRAKGKFCANHEEPGEWLGVRKKQWRRAQVLTPFTSISICLRIGFYFPCWF